MSDPNSSLYGEQPQVPDSKTPDLLDQITGVFMEPKALFTRLRNRPSWLPALATAVIIGLIAMLIWAAKVDLAESTRHQMERTRAVFHVKIPDEAMDEAISKADGKHPWFSATSGAVLGTPFIYLVVGLIVWGCGSMGTEEGEERPTFGQAFSVTSVHYLTTLPSMFLAGFIALLRPVGGAQIQVLMPTTLSFYVQPSSEVARALVALVDPLWLFSFFVLAQGMRHTLKSKPWAIALCLGIFAVFGGGFRMLGGLFQ